VASSYPGGLDSFTNPSGTDELDSTTVPHAAQHADANDAIEAIETTLGTDPAGSATDVAGRLDGVDSTVSGKADMSSLAGVATSGAYSDLSGTPALKNVATSGKYSDLSGTPNIPSKASDVGAVAAVQSGLKLWTGSQPQYDAITGPDANTLYVVKGS
jgi:hypothetical protein